MTLRYKLFFILVVRVLFPEVAQAGVVITQPFQGVTYIVWSETVPRPVTMHVVEVDLTAPGIQFKLTTPGGSRETIRQSTLEFLKQEQVQVAINGHFMLPFPSTDTNVQVVGLAASKGKVYSGFEPQPIGTGAVDQSYAILPYAPALNIDSENRVSLVRREMAGSPEPLKLWNTVSGSAQIVSNGVSCIPTYTGRPGGLRAFNNYSDANSWYALIRARTAIGVTEDGQTLVLFTVDEAGGSSGMTVAEVADVLIREHRVYQALNLDGGGSSTMAFQEPMTLAGRIVNVPSDNPLGRAVGSNLGVFARPMPRPMIAATSANRLIISWPASLTGWHLQESADLSVNGWIPVSIPPENVGHLKQVILAPQEAQRFFRLEQ